MPPYKTPELGEGVPDAMQKDADRIYKDLRETTYRDETHEDKAAAAGTMWKRLKFTWKWVEAEKKWVRKESKNSVQYSPMMALPAPGATVTAGRTQQADRCRLFENTILQGLDQWLPSDDGKVQGSYYPLSAFEPTANEWGDGVPIVFAAKHPKVGGLRMDEQATLNECSTDQLKARVVGGSDSAVIIKKGIGRPVLKVSLGKICDPEVQQLYDEARLGISSAFECDQTEDGKYILGEVHPDHILLFPRDALRGAEQRDMVAMVNAMIGELETKEDNDVTNGNQTNKGAEFSAKNKGKMMSVLHGLRAHLDTLMGMMGYDDLFRPVPQPEGGTEENLESLTKRAGEAVNARTYPYVPKNPADYKKTTGSWIKPALKDFTEKLWDDLSETEKGKIRSCFAVVTGETFGDCHLPHHEPDGTLNANGVRNALARFDQTQGLGNASTAAKAHLESHLAEFKEDEKAGEAKENTMVETETNKKAYSEDSLKKMAEDMGVTPEKLRAHLDKMKSCEEEDMKTNKKAAAKTDEELGDEATGKDDSAAEAKEKKAKELLEEAEAEEEGNKRKNSRLNALEQKVADMEARDKLAKKRDFTNMLKPGYTKQADTLFAAFTEDPVTFMRTNQGMFATSAGETKLDGLEHVPEGDVAMKGKSIAQMNDREFEGYVKQRATQLNARMDGNGQHSTVGTNVRRDPNNPGVFHANMLGTEGQ